jgi:hypothetical protein
MRNFTIKEASSNFITKHELTKLLRKVRLEFKVVNLYAPWMEHGVDTSYGYGEDVEIYSWAGMIDIYPPAGHRIASAELAGNLARNQGIIEPHVLFEEKGALQIRTCYHVNSEKLGAPIDTIIQVHKFPKKYSEKKTSAIK